MVEGPGATRNADNIRRSLLISGATIVESIECNIISKPTMNMIHMYVGLSLQEVFSIGKEVFLIFSDNHQALRLHFGMNGTVVTVTQTSSTTASNGQLPQRRNAVLTIRFSNNNKILQCFATTVNSVKAQVAHVKYCTSACILRETFVPPHFV